MEDTQTILRSPTRNYDILLKLLVLGNSAVGKTSLILKYTESRFNYNFVSTVGIDFKHKTIEFEDLTVKLQIWDTAGQEVYFSITKTYFRGVAGILLVFDLTSLESFKNLDMWLQNVEQYASSDVKIVLVGNKCDITDRRIITTEEAERKAKSFNCQYYETSAKENINVSEVFENLAQDLIERNDTILKNVKNRNVSTTDLHKQSPLRPSSGCCK